jgi:hypothetical protein
MFSYPLLTSPEEAPEVDVPLKLGFQLLYPDAADGCVVDQGGGQTGGQGVQQVFHRVGALVLSRQDGWFVCVQLVSLLMGILLVCAEEIPDGGMVVASAYPLVADAELEIRDVGLSFDGLHRVFHRRYVHAVYDLLGHEITFPFMTPVILVCVPFTYLIAERETVVNKTDRGLRHVPASIFRAG